MDDSLREWIYGIAAGGAVLSGVYFLVYSILEAREQAEQFEEDAPQTRSAALRIVRPFARWAGFLIGKLSARIEMRLGRDSNSSLLLNTRIRLRKSLSAAGSPEGLTPDEFLGLILLSAIGGLGVGFIFYMRAQIGAFPIAGCVMGAAMPVFWLRKQIHKRMMSIRRLLPYTIDLLSLSVMAGLDFTEALYRMVHKLGHSALAVELGETLRQIRLGKSRTEALRDLSNRVDLPELRSVVSALIQTDELGGRLAPILRAQSEQLRVQRSQYAEKLAMQAPVKILFPLIFFIFPCIFVMIFGPIVVKYVGQ